ncbi:MAG: LysE family transporter [Endomicrobium sp.]|jgi:threonine/homoserine/homoserine lactone efflux protein|nr:LysE family transporter [Endomicrobium sp.]
MDLAINKKNNLLFDGLKTGLLLQIMGIGPICVLIFKLSLSIPFSKLILGIIGITLADIIYIFLAVISISAVIKKLQRFQRSFDILVGIALIIFGILFITAGQSINIDTFQGQDLFLWLFGLTIVNPMTILFITGIFSFEISRRNMNLKDASIFAFGFLLATPIFATCVIIIGNLAGIILPETIVKTLNAAMGFILIYLGIKNIFFKKLNQNERINNAAK